MVGVVEPDQVGQLQMAGQCCGLVRNSFHHVAVGADRIHAVIDDLVLGLIEVSRQPALGDGHAHRVRDPLPQRSGGRLYAGREVVLRMPGALGAKLAEALDLGERKVIAGQVQHRVEQHGGVSGGEHHAVAIRPVRIRRAIPQDAVPQHVGHRSQSHRGSRMSAVRLLHGVDGERANGVYAQLVERRGLRWIQVCCTFADM